MLSYYSVVEKGLKGQWYGVFQGRRYQVFDDPNILDELYRLREAERKDSYVRQVMESRHLWRQNVELSDEEVAVVARYMESIRDGDAIDVDVWSGADTMNSE